jgi:MoxR-like ATPase
MVDQVLRQPAEQRYADELARLAQSDAQRGVELPPGWKLSPNSVRSFIIGDEKLGVSRKFYGDDPLVDRAIVTLLGRQGLMLVGEPGTAKSMLSALLSAAISGTSMLTVQGTAGTTEDHIRYSWNYALLLAEGPTQRALVPSAIYRAMQSGAVARFEEITRCPPEIQDVLVSIMSEKHLVIPEFGDGGVLAAQPGFQIIATANLRDRGVHEMSAALKRRFNFETVHPISDKRFELELVNAQLAAQLGELSSRVRVNSDVVDMLVTVFRDLRAGRTDDGTPVKVPETVMSTAEAVNVAYASAMQALYLGDGTLDARAVAGQLAGVVTKDSADDVDRMRAYVDSVARARAQNSPVWHDFYQAGRALWK